MLLQTILDHPAAPIALRCYYEKWAGRRFESLGRHNDAVYEQNAITPSDIVAVHLLNVDIPPKVIINLLEGDLGRQLIELLIGVPTNVELGTADAAQHVGPESHAQKAWELLRNHVGGAAQGDGQAWVIAGKLLARKRPHLIPIYDRVVKCVWSPPAKENYWLWLGDRAPELRRDRRVHLSGQRCKIHPETVGGSG